MSGGLIALSLAVVAAGALAPAPHAVVHAQEAAEQPAPDPWFELPTGRFFAGGGDALGLTGYAIVDETNGAPWWSSYVLLGGAESLGQPVSRPFALPDAHVYQAFEYALLRWRPGLVIAEIAETLDLMWAAGRDEWLAANGVPRAAAAPDVSQLARIAWLTHDPIRDAYFSATHPAAETGLPAALLRYGLPAGAPLHDETGATQRFDRAALRWDAATETLTPIPVGKLLAQSGLLDARALAPDRVVGGLMVTRAPRPLLNWPNSRGWGVPEEPPRAPDPPTQSGENPDTAAAPSGLSPTPTTAAPAPFASPTPTTRPGTATDAAAPAGPRSTPAGAPPAAAASVVLRAVINQGRAEHVVVANDGSAPQELTGWTLRSGTGGQILHFPAGFVLQPGATVRMHSGSGAASQNRPPTDLFASSANVWNNQGDSAQLLDPAGRIVSQLTYRD